MRNVLRHSVLAAGLLIAFLGLGNGTAHAQLRTNRPGYGPSRSYYYNPYAQVPWMPLAQPAIPINPNWWVGPGLTIRQAAYNQAMMNYATFAYTPFQWYNPFVNTVNYANFAPYYSFYGNPYRRGYYNPYAGFGYGGVYMNPYAFVYGGY